MNPQLIKKYLFYFILILVAVSIVKVANTSGDFKIFLGAAQLISENKSPYHEWIFVSEGNLGLYYYSPLWAVILIPFNLIPHFITNLIWLIANVYFLYRITRFLISCTESLNISQKQLNWILIVAAAMSFRFALYNFGMIQMTIFLLWGILESLDLIRKEKFLLAGMLLALVINIKLLPMVFIPYLIYRREFKTVVSALICSILFIFLPAIVVGWSGNIFLLSEWWSVINPSNPEHLLESELGPHSLTALIPSLLTITDGNLPNTRNIFNIEIGLTNFIMNGIRFFLIFLTCYFLKWPPFKKTESRMHQLWEVCYILLLIPLIFPHQQKYAFIHPYLKS